MPAFEDSPGVTLQGEPRIIDKDRGDISLFKPCLHLVGKSIDKPGFDQQTRCSAPDRIKQKIVSIAPLSAHSGKQLAWYKLAAIVTEGIKTGPRSSIAQNAIGRIKQVIEIDQSLPSKCLPIINNRHSGANVQLSGQDVLHAPHLFDHTL